MGICLRAGSCSLPLFVLELVSDFRHIQGIDDLVIIELSIVER